MRPDCSENASSNINPSSASMPGKVVSGTRMTLGSESVTGLRPPMPNRTVPQTTSAPAPSSATR